MWRDLVFFLTTIAALPLKDCSFSSLKIDTVRPRLEDFGFQLLKNGKTEMFNCLVESMS